MADDIKWDEDIKWDSGAEKPAEKSEFFVRGHVPPAAPRRPPAPPKPEFTEGQTVMVNGKPRQVVMVNGEPRYKEDVAPSKGYRQINPLNKANMAILAGLQAQATPIAGALQWMGVDKPAEIMKRNADYAKGIAGNYASGAELASEIVNPFSIKALQYGQKGLNMIPKVKDSVLATSGGLGALQAALTPTAEGQSKAEQMGYGALGGAGFGKLTQTVMAPQVSAQLKKLKDMGMSTFTPGQLMADIPLIGPGIQKAEKALTSLPLTGSIIGGGLLSSGKDFNRMLGNKVLEPLGLKVPKDIPEGNAMIQHVKETLGNNYDNVVNNATFRNAIDPKTGATAVENIWNRMTKVGNNLVPKQREALERDVTDNIIKHIEGNTVLNGNQFRAAEKYLGGKANGYFEQGFDDLGNAYMKVQQSLRSELEKQNPHIANVLSKTHEAFKRFIPVEKAAAMRGSTEGVFSPQQFKSAAESSAGRAGVASGTGRMIPEAQAGMQTLGATLPNSGTADRLLTGKGLLDIGMHAGTMGIPLATAAMAYNPIAMKLMSSVATGARPEVVQKMAPLMTQGSAQLGSITAAQPKQKAPLSSPQNNPVALP